MNSNLLEINAFVFLRRMSEKYGKKLTLLTIPEKEWRAIAARGFDWVWLMGVWKRSPGARQCALSEKVLLRDYDAVPGWKEEDVAASPYAVFDYVLDPFLGHPADLGDLKKKFNDCGLKLILDYVPNHLALDHPDTARHPDRFMQGAPDDFKNYREIFYAHAGRYFAHGKDPYFPAWQDTVQVNYFSPSARKAAVQELSLIAAAADGVRCDMAMLGLHDVFENLWRPWITQMRPSKEFWHEIIPEIKKKFPGFIFIAEVYWDLEARLQHLGFDFTYDKKLYDYLQRGAVKEIRTHLEAEISLKEHPVRFIENHDERRAAEAFGEEKSLAAAVVTGTLPGVRFIHDGQMQGKKIRLPVQLTREPAEDENLKISAFYERLLRYAGRDSLRRGQWQMLRVSPASPEDPTHQNFLAWAWKKNKEISLVVINYSGASSRGRVHIGAGFLAWDFLALHDEFSGKSYRRDREEILRLGLYVALEAWEAHLFTVSSGRAE